MVYEWDWAGAERSFLEAIELRPGYAVAHHWYALYLSAVGRFDQALAEIMLAEELDPLALSIVNSVAMVYLWAHRYDEAKRAIQRTIEIHPRFPSPYWYLGTVELATGSLGDALSHLRTADELSSGTVVAISAMLAYAYAKLGEREKALNIAATLTGRYERAYASPVWIALVHVGLGDRQKAVEWLNTACDERDGWLRILKTAPFFDEIRDTPEFAGVLRKIGLDT